MTRLHTAARLWVRAIIAGTGVALVGLAGPEAHAQQADTLRLMHYNLCNYGNPVFACTRVNRIGWKDSSLRTVFSQFTPDMVGFNEINKAAAYTDRLRDQVLNAGPYQDWAAAAPTNVANSDLINAFFYRTSKVGLKAQYVVPSPVRDINHYRMYAQPLPGQTDTVFFNVIQAHLKAGSTSGDTLDRRRMVDALNAYLATKDTSEGFYFQGDFNVYRATEPANQRLVNPARGGNFRDPLNRQGSWTANASFADVHTQSPWGGTADGCHANGGIDDRFDFQLCTAGLLNPERRITYLPSAFRVIGNDGRHYNKDVTEQPNTSAPAQVIAALKHSDHLPIFGKMLYRAPVAVRARLAAAAEKAWLGGRNLYVSGLRGAATATVYAVTGAELGTVQLLADGTPAPLPATVPAEGVVVLRVTPLDLSAAPATFRLLLSNPQ